MWGEGGNLVVQEHEVVHTLLLISGPKLEELCLNCVFMGILSM